MKNFFKRDKSRAQQLRGDIDKLNKQINIVKSSYNLETDELLIDSHIYEICALENKINFLIRELKNLDEFKINEDIGIINEKIN